MIVSLSEGRDSGGKGAATESVQGQESGNDRLT